MSAPTLALLGSTGTMPMLTPIVSALSRQANRKAPSTSRRSSAKSMAVSVGAIGKQHGELVAAQAREDVAARNLRLQDVAQLAKQQVAGAVAAGVVHDLELVEIHVQQRGALLGILLHDFQRRGQPFLELAPVDQAGQRIVAREVRELAVQLPLLAHVVKHHHGADDVAAAILNRRRGILDGHDLPVTPSQDNVVRELHDSAFLQAAQDRILDELAGGLVRELDDVLDRIALCFAALPAGELLGHGIQVIDEAARIRSDDRIADRLQRHLRPLLLVE